MSSNPITDTSSGTRSPAYEAAVINEYAVTSEWEKTAVGRRPTGSANSSRDLRSEEHTSELQSLMRNTYARFWSKKKKEDSTQCQIRTELELKSITIQRQRNADPTLVQSQSP